MFFFFRIVKTDNSSVDAVKELVKNAIPQTELIRFHGKEVSLLLPSSYTDKFPYLFTILEENIGDLSGSIVESYGISMTTLEEVQ